MPIPFKRYKGMKKIFIGIDFSKEKFDATVIKAEGVEERAERQHEVFDNKVSGFRRLLRWVKSVVDEQDTGLWLFCGENTGGYSRALCNYLYGSGYDMWLENALSIKRSSALQRTKSDKADAGVIAEYAMRNYDQMRLYKPLDKNLERLREVFLYRHNLVKLKASMTVRKGEKKLTQEKSDISRFMAQSSRHLISEFNKKIAECDRRIQKIIAGDEDLRRNFEIITSVPGVGTQNAVCLMVYTDNFGRFDYNSRCLLLWRGSVWKTIRNQCEHTPACKSVRQQTHQGTADTGRAGIGQFLSADGCLLQKACRCGKEEACGGQ